MKHSACSTAVLLFLCFILVSPAGPLLLEAKDEYFEKLTSYQVIDPVAQSPFELSGALRIDREDGQETWFHGDGGRAPWLYRMRGTAHDVKRFLLHSPEINVQNRDWEACVYDPSEKLIWVIDGGGNNFIRDQVELYAFNPTEDVKEDSSSIRVRRKIVLKFPKRFPGGSEPGRDIEAAFLVEGILYLLDKNSNAVDSFALRGRENGTYRAKNEGFLNGLAVRKRDGKIMNMLWPTEARYSAREKSIYILTYKALFVCPVEDFIRQNDEGYRGNEQLEVVHDWAEQFKGMSQEDWAEKRFQVEAFTLSEGEVHVFREDGAAFVWHSRAELSP